MVLCRVDSDRSQNSSRHSDEQLMLKFTSQGLKRVHAKSLLNSETQTDF